MQNAPAQTLIPWKRFKDSMPMVERPVIVMFTDVYDESPDFMWLHTKVGCVDQRGFGHIFLSEDGNQASEYDHARMLESGHWAYIADFAHGLRSQYDHGLVVHGDYEDLGNVA